MKKALFLAGLIVFVVLISGCAEPQATDACESPGSTFKVTNQNLNEQGWAITVSNIYGQSLSGLGTTSKTEPLVQNETVLIQPTNVLAGETFRITTSGAYSKDKLFITIFDVSYTSADGFNWHRTIRCSGKA